MKVLKVLIIFTIVFSNLLFSQSAKQSIIGIVLDEFTGYPLPYANIQILSTINNNGTSTDSNGRFIINNIPVGRYNLKISYIGYETKVITGVEVNSSNETFIEIKLKEKAFQTNEIIIKPDIDKSSSINSFSDVTAKMLSIDEAKRYAGGFDDPARLVSSFAGISSNIGNNAIIVRGNSPQYFKWMLEGIEIRNPNHFSDLSTFGGGGLTALSSNLLANSDFISGAFPAEYGNAISGIFDIKMRRGSNNNFNHSFQLGLIGVDFCSEGPVKRGSSSYLFNYRYSTLSLLEPLLPENSGGIKYHDLSFKFNFDNDIWGNFDFWGIGLMDHSGQNIEKDSTKWKYYNDKEDQKVDQYMAVIGMNHSKVFSKQTYIKNSLAFTIDGIKSNKRRFINNFYLPQESINIFYKYFIYSSKLNHKISKEIFLKGGLSLTLQNFSIKLKERNITCLKEIIDKNGTASLYSSFITFSYNKGRFIFIPGIYAQYFSINKSLSLEPRLSITYKISNSTSLGLAFGKHSRTERLNYYFIKHNDRFINKSLKFTNAYHFVLNYKTFLDDKLFFKIETYYQKLFDVPVIPDSTYSIINDKNNWFFTNKLVNKGEGRNFGVEITFEKFLTKGFYYLLTGSIFKSEYKDFFGTWHPTRYNKKFLFNFLIGREWFLGKKKNKSFNISIRTGFQGGEKYSPINEIKSKLEKQVVYDEHAPFSKSFRPQFSLHFTISYKINSNDKTYEFALKVLNATASKEFTEHRFNLKTHKTDEIWDSIIIPNLSFKVSF